MARLALNRKTLEAFMRSEGITNQNQLAKRMGVSPSTVKRLIDGTTAPGPAVLAGFRTAFPGRSTDDLTTLR